MSEDKIYEEIDHHRRRFFGAATVAIAAAQFGVIGSTHAETKRTALPPRSSQGRTRRSAH
jgi:hypothetical protein